GARHGGGGGHAAPTRQPHRVPQGDRTGEDDMTEGKKKFRGVLFAESQRQKMLRAEADIKALLQPEEKIVRIATIHDAIYWKGAVVTLIGVLLMLTIFNLGVFMTFVGLVL